MKKRDSINSAIIGIYRLLLFVFIIGCLYYGQRLLIPLTLAGLLTFFLSPIVAKLERWLGRVIAILFAVIVLMMPIGMVGYILTNQAIEFTAELPYYKTNIVNKLNALNLQKPNAVAEILDTVQKVKSHLPSYSQIGSSVKKDPVNVIESSTNDLTSLFKKFLASLLDIVGSTGLVFLLAIFMLFTREDLRARFIKLIGRKRISATTSAMDEASNRVAQYLLMQVLLNTIYGIIVTIGLYFIGVPNAILWGGLAIIFRFIPYFGAWIGASIPFIVTLAVSTTWTMPLLTVILFVSLDLVTANIVEPILCPSSTGISSLGLIVSAVFWTLLWGPVGLLLSTPLTVCILVMSRYVPSLAFLSVLFSNEETHAAAEECYQQEIAV